MAAATVSRVPTISASSLRHGMAIVRSTSGGMPLPMRALAQRRRLAQIDRTAEALEYARRDARNQREVDDAFAGHLRGREDRPAEMCPADASGVLFDEEPDALSHRRGEPGRGD